MPSETETDNFELKIQFAGGLADLGTLDLEEYAQSLSGWQEFFKLANDIYIRSKFPAFATSPSDILQIRVIAEREGSFLTVIEFVLATYAAELIKNAAASTYKEFPTRFKKWYRDLARNHVAVKAKTTNIEEISGALKALADQNEIDLEASPGEQVPLLTLEEDEIEDRPTNASKQRQISEKLDEHLKAATRPLEKSCTHILVSDQQDVPIIAIGLAERAIIADPLTLPPPKRDWVEASVHFVRIHRKTGRAMFYFKGESETTHGAHFSKIIDSRIKLPGNPYTVAFNENAALDVWVRQRAAPPGRLNIQWDITAQAPDFDGLFA